MQKNVRKYLAVVMVLLSCHRTGWASLEELFPSQGATPPENGLVLEIAVPKQRHFFFEPVIIFARFTNVTDEPIALVVEERGLSGIDAKLSWQFSSLDGHQGRPSPIGIAVQNALVVPEHGAVCFALPDKMFPIGKTRTSIQYKHLEESKRPPLGGVRLWQGEVKSNELEIVIEDKKDLTPEDRRSVDEKIRRHVELFESPDPMVAYWAQGGLTRLGKYSVPVLVESLRRENRPVQINAIETLGRIASATLASELGFERDVSCLNELLSTYNRERNVAIKQAVVRALIEFRDVEPEQRAQIVQTLRAGIKHGNKSLRVVAAAVLLQVSREDGIAEVIDRIGDDAYFGETGQQQVLQVLQDTTGQKLGPSPSEWNKWWRENKGEKK